MLLPDYSIDILEPLDLTETYCKTSSGISVGKPKEKSVALDFGFFQQSRLARSYFLYMDRI